LGVIWESYDYLGAAANRGMGTYEYDDTWGQGHSDIDYLRLEHWTRSLPKTQTDQT